MLQLHSNAYPQIHILISCRFSIQYINPLAPELLLLLLLLLFF